MSIPAFMIGAPCSRIDPEAMFPAPSDTVGISAAKRTCAGCEFRIECLEMALDPASRCAYGVFGGLTEEQREELIKVRKIGKAHRLDYGPIPPRNKRLAAAA